MEWSFCIRNDNSRGQSYEGCPRFLERNNMRKIDRFERWLDKYNHIMELMRTFIPLITLILQIFIIINLLK